MKKAKVLQVPDNFSNLPSQTSDYLTDATYGGEVLVYSQYSPLASRLTLLKQGSQSIPPPTLVIPATQPTELNATNALALPTPTTQITAKQPTDYVPTVDPILTDKVYATREMPTLTAPTGTPTLRMPGETLTQYRDRITTAIRTPVPATTSIWIWLILAAVIIAGIVYYAKKKGKL